MQVWALNLPKVQSWKKKKKKKTLIKRINAFQKVLQALQEIPYTEETGMRINAFTPRN